MEYFRCGDKIVLRLDPKDEITESIIKLAEKENISAAGVSGIGATDDFTVGVFDMKKGDYEKFFYNGNHEINVLTGNITEVNGKPYVHLHLSATGKGGKVVGGHLIKAIISLTAEIIVDIIPADITRKRNETLKINTLSFK